MAKHLKMQGLDAGVYFCVFREDVRLTVGV